MGDRPEEAVALVGDGPCLFGSGPQLPLGALRQACAPCTERWPPAAGWVVDGGSEDEETNGPFEDLFEDLKESLPEETSEGADRDSPWSTADMGLLPHAETDRLAGAELSFHRLLALVAAEHRRALASLRQELQQPGLREEKWSAERDSKHESCAEASDGAWLGSSGSALEAPSPNNKKAPTKPVLRWQTHEDEQGRTMSWEHSSFRMRLSQVGGWHSELLQRYTADFFFKHIKGVQAFDTLSSMAIMLNLILEGCSADQAMSESLLGRAPEHTAPVLQAATASFTIWFCLELLIRIRLKGLRKFFIAEDWAWNWFDLGVVTTDVTLSLLAFARNDDETKGGIHNLTAIRILRVLRITRAVRVLRLVRLFRDLRMMLFSIVQSGSALLWSLVLLGITIYAFSTYFIQVVAIHIHEQTDLGLVDPDRPKLEEMFGTLVKSQYTLYLAVSGGISWGEICKLLINIDVAHGIVFCFYTFFTTFALLNIITGIFVETSINSARNNREEVAQEQIQATVGLLEDMKSMFMAADQDGNGTINLHEFEMYLDRREVRAYLNAVGIEINKAPGIFQLLDVDRSGEITVEEFAFGCLRLKGWAKAVDLATLTNYTRRMSEQWRDFFSFTEQQFQNMQDMQARLEGRLSCFLPDEEECES